MFIIYDQVIKTLYHAPGCFSSKHYSQLQNAKATATRLNKKRPGPHNTVGNVRFVAMSREEFDRLFDPIVTVVNSLTGTPVQLRESQLGGINDPSTERYHSF